MKKAKQILFQTIITVVFVSSLLVSCEKDKDKDDDNGNTLSITSFEPLSCREGDTVTISGTGFNATGSQNTVLFTDNVEAPAFNASETQLQVTVPTGTQNGPITISTGGQTAVSVDSFIVDISVGAPEITSIAPEHGTVGQEVVIQGYKFLEDTNNLVIKFGDIEITENFELQNWDQLNELTFNVPAGVSEGAVQVSVIRDGMESNKLDFTVEPTPKEVRRCYWNTEMGLYAGYIEDGVKTQKELYSYYDSYDFTLLGIGSITLDTIQGYIYWATSDFLSRAPIDGGGTIETFNGGDYGLRRMQDMAIDMETGTVYIANRRKSTLSFIATYNFSSNVFDTLYTSEETYDGIYGVTIDKTNNYIYWSEYTSKKIKRAALDGSSAEPETIYECTNIPRTIKVDAVNQRLYMYEAVENTDGTGTQNILTGSTDGTSALQILLSDIGPEYGGMYDFEIDAEGYLYWLTLVSAGAGNGAIKRAKLDGSGGWEEVFTEIENGKYFELVIN